MFIILLFLAFVIKY